MFLTKNALKKIRRFTIAYLALAGFCFAISAIFASFMIEYKLLVVLGIISLVLCALFRATGIYAEGKGKLINSGNKLITRDLRPAEFIRLYEEKRDCPDNVISEPDFEVLHLLVVAYDALGDAHRALGTLEYMISVAPPQKHDLIKVLKSSFLYGMGKTDEAEAIYLEMTAKKTDIVTRTTLDITSAIDRAMALGDYTTAEARARQMLAQSVPKPTPLATLAINYILGKVCYKTDRFDEARQYLNYCAINGGETTYKTEAIDMLRNM